MAANETPIKIQVFSDYICPWCYVGLARVDKLREEYNVEIDYQAFFLRPDIGPAGAPRKARPGEQEVEPGTIMTSPVGQLGAEAGLVMKRSALTPYTRLALEATEYAKSKGKVEEMHHALFKSYWGDGVNLGELPVLLDVADKAGLDADDLKKHIEAHTYQQVITEQYEFAQEVGITGIPAFIIGQYLFMGAHPYSFFQQVMERVMREREEENQILLK